MLDPYRPRYHFTPAKNWMNDPIPFFWNGSYHIYFQHNPGAPVWGDMHWGHAVSRDLTHWELLPIALAPTPGGPDGEGVFTGCIVEDAGLFYALYTGIPKLEPLEQVQCLASSPDLIHWEKRSDNPIIGSLPPGFGGCFRDPQVWREGDGWRMLVGGEQAERKGGAALLYRSSDLFSWEYQHPLALCETAKTGHECECPDFFPLGDKYVFLSSSGQTWWQTGSYDGSTFTSERLGPADSEVFYAAKTLLDEAGRRLLFGWLRETRPEAEQINTGWSGVLSLPRVLTLLPDGTLGQKPAPELAALRGRHHHFENLAIDEGACVLDGIQGDTLEILVCFAPGSAALTGLSARCAADGTEGVEFLYGPSLDGDGLSLRVFVDRSVFEAFANERTCETRPGLPACRSPARRAAGARRGTGRFGRRLGIRGSCCAWLILCRGCWRGLRGTSHAR